MPLYDYQCSTCQQVTEVRHGFDEPHAEPCPKCGGALKRVFNPAPILFKGSGFYVTDSRKSSAAAGSAEKTPTESKTEAKPADATSSPAAAPAAAAPATTAPTPPTKESAA